MKLLKTHIALTIGLLFGLQASAQTKIDPTLEVKRDFDGKIQEFSKSKLSTQLPDSVRSFNLNMEYTIFNKTIKDLYEFSPLPSAQLVSASKAKLPFVYARVGMGIPATPEFDFEFQPRIGNNNTFLIRASHTSFLGNLRINKTENGTLTESNFEANAQNMRNEIYTGFGRYWKKGQFKIGLIYDKDFYTWYGYDEDLISAFNLSSGNSVFNINNLSNQKFMRDSLSHTIDKLGAQISLKSVNSSAGTLWYDFKAAVTYLKETPSLYKEVAAVPFNEKSVNVSLDLSPYYTQKHKFFIKVGYEGSNSLVSGDFDRGNIELYPNYKLNYKFLAFSAGIVYNHYFSGTSDSARSNVYARADITAELVKKHLWIYGNLDGGNNFTTYENLIRTIPWLGPGLTIKSTNIPYSATIGFRGEMLDRLEFNIKGGITKFENAPYFFNREDNLNTNPIHNLLQVGYTNFTRSGLTGEIIWNSTDITGGLKASFYNFKADEGMKAWDQASTTINLFARYNYRERIIAGADVEYCGKREVRSLGGDLYLPAYNKLNLRGAYVYDKNLSFYLDVNNLFNSREFTALYYRQLGINVRGGVVIKF